MAIKASKEKGINVKVFDKDNVPNDLPENWVGFNKSSDQFKCADNDGDTRGSTALVDPSAFGNWVEIFSGDYNADSIDEDITISSDSEQLRIIVEGVSISENIRMTYNNDTGSNYRRSLISQTGTTISSYGNTTVNYILVGISSSSQYSENLCTLKLGTHRFIQRRTSRYISSSSTSNMYFYSHRWTNQTSTINSIQLSNNSGSYTGIVKVFKWQDIKPVQLHSYELVKEYDLSVVNPNGTSFDWDPNDESMHIEWQMKKTQGNIGVRPNGDDGSNYRRALIHTNSAVVTGGYGLDSYFRLTQACSHTAGTADFQLKEIGYNIRSCESHHTFYSDTDTDRVLEIVSSRWLNSADLITSFEWYVDGAPTSGYIRVYRMATTHLICTQPGLNTLWSKSVDADTIEVQSGDVEINGIVHNVATAKEVTLSGNLRTTESETASTYYYLYAIKSDARVPTYKFSTSKPTLNRFGQTVDFDETVGENPLYHPIEGTTWRYIGQVYNDASSNILSFSKCKPGYWESTWNAIPAGTYNVIPHGLSTIPITCDYMCSSSSIGSDPQISSELFYYGNYYGVSVNRKLPSTTSSINTYFSAEGIWYDGGVWQTTGYYKLTVKTN